MLNAGVVMPFFMLKIVGGVGSNFGVLLFALLQMIFVVVMFCFCFSLEQYVRVTDCTDWHTCMLFVFKIVNRIGRLGQ